MRTSLQVQLINLRIGLQLWYDSLTVHGGRVLPTLGAAALLLVILAGPAQAAPSFRSGASTSYFGLTSQDAPLVLEVSKDGRVVKRAEAALDMNCTDGGAPYVMTFRDSWADVVVGLNRTFKQSYSDSDTLPSGTTVEESSDFGGRFDRKRSSAKGTWHLKLVFHYTDGTTTSCESGVLHFTARRMQG